MPVAEAVSPVPGVPTTQTLLKGAHPRKGLNQWLATGICGNDITSSVLYVSGIAAVYAGVLAPVVLLAVIVVLYLYKKVYTEVVEALPLNGGTDNCLLNSTSKFAASMAACMTILSYIATAVLSAKTAIEYLDHAFPYFDVMQGTLILMGVFAVLAIIGITESARVALGILVVHMLTLIALAIVGFASVPLDLHIFRENLTTLPSGSGLLTALVFGFAAASLGISGFESSANFVEEQRAGVFRKTLRNMLIMVAIFNPLMSILSLNLLPLNDIVRHKDYLLSEVGMSSGGTILSSVVAIDAMMVLSGAVLTAFIGVTGLFQRLALDQSLPRFFLRQNRRGTYHRIIITFFLLCASILLVTRGQLLSLAGVYTISFLGVMTIFALGDMLLRVRRKELKRTYVAGWGTMIAAALATTLGIAGNIAIDYRNVLYFLQYFVPTALVVVLMYSRIPILTGSLQILDRGAIKLSALGESIARRISAITQQRIVLFVRHADLRLLHDAMVYIRKNESMRSVVVVHLVSRSVNDL